MKKSLIVSFLFLFSVLFFDASAFAQRRIDTLPTTMGCYRQPVTPISHALNLHTDMPLDCIIGYIYFDSLCRSLQSRQQLDSLLATINSWDTIRIFMRFLYRMEEYDADLFREYEFGAVYLDTSYRISPAVVAFKFWERMNTVLGAQNKFNYLTECPVILHIRVYDVGISYDSLSDMPFKSPPVKCVTALVIDTIKGKHLRAADTTLWMGQSGKGQKIQSYSPLINIAYRPYEPKLNARGDFFSQSLDTTVIGYRCDSCYGQNALVVGKDYIIFLEDMILDYNGTYSFYQYDPYSYYNVEGGIFPLDSSGNVLSQDNYFGYGSSVSLAAFEAYLNADIQSIISH